jgi:hypothetical protein
MKMKTMNESRRAVNAIILRVYVLLVFKTL